jgi:hypothetical protein
MGTTEEGLDELALAARRARETVEEHRAALARYALVWWEGGAADHYRQLVEERRAALAVELDRLEEVELLARALADRVRADTGGLRPGPAS